MKKWQFRFKWGWVIALACAAILAATLWYFAPDWLDGWKAEQVEAQLVGLYPRQAEAGLTQPLAPEYAHASVSPDSQTAMPAQTTASGQTAELASAKGNTAQPVETPEPTHTVQPNDTPLPVPTPMPTVPPIHEDFAELYEQNRHIIGWITCGESIDYPVVQSDNDYYLHHDFFGKKDNNGTIFLNANNTLWPSDDVLLLHGHNMRSGKMFRTLHEYRDEVYMRQHPIVTFRTVYDAQDVYYIPIAAFEASMEKWAKGYFDITQIVFHNDDEPETTADAMKRLISTPTPAPSPARQSKEFQAYLDDILRLSLWDSPADVNVDDQLLMLVTCGSSYENGRLMLVCRKLREGETVEEMLALFSPEPDPTETPMNIDRRGMYQ